MALRRRTSSATSIPENFDRLDPAAQAEAQGFIKRCHSQLAFRSIIRGFLNEESPWPHDEYIQQLPIVGNVG
ncbi:hypothetical protein KXV52_003939 [Aspergillus fumigatus]|nr:hypothetical protein KXV52_003939 [Aspergillus fumigatus]